MPTVPYSPLRDVAPSTGSPSNYQNIAAQPADFGAQVGAADVGLAAKIEGAGDAAEHAAVAIQTLHNNVAVDSAFNSHQTLVNNVLYGDPNKPGDPGFFGLRGEAALRARPTVLKQLSDSRENLAASLDNGTQQLGFNEASRRLNMFSTEQVGRHYETEYNRWATETQSAGIDIAARDASNNYNSEEAFQHNLADANSRADAKSALAGADPNSPEGKSIYADNRLQAAQVIYRARAVGMGNNDPVAAEEFLKKNQDKFDAITFHSLQSEFRVKAEQAQVAGVISGINGTPARTGGAGPGGGANTGPIRNTALPPEAQRFLPALSMGEGHYGSPAPLGDRSQTPISNNRYQFLYNTWAGAAPAAGVNPGDRSPEAQDAVAWSHAQDIYRRNTGADLQADIAAGGNVAKIAGALNKTWPSLPGGKEQQETLPQFAAQLGQPMAGPRAGTSPDQPALAPAAAGGQPAAVPTSMFGWEQQRMQLARERAAQAFPAREDLQRQVRDGVWSEIQQTNVLQAKYEAEQTKAKKDAQEKVGDQIYQQIVKDPAGFDPKVIDGNSTLDYQQKEHFRTLALTMLERSQGKGIPLAAISHQNTTELNRRLTLPDGDPNKITDMRPIDDAFNRGDLSTANYGFLKQQFTDSRTPDGERLGQTMQRFLAAVKPSIEKSNPLQGQLDMTGGTEFFRLQQDVAERVARYRKEGKNPFDLFDPAKPDYVGTPASIAEYQKSIPESLEEYKKRLAGDAARAAGKPLAPPPALPPKAR